MEIVHTTHTNEDGTFSPKIVVGLDGVNTVWIDRSYAFPEDSLKTVGYVMYYVHPNTRVDPVDGGLIYPKGHLPTKLSDRTKRRRMVQA